MALSRATICFTPNILMDLLILQTSKIRPVSQLTLPEGSDFNLTGDKSSGSIKTEFNLSDYSKSDGKIKGTAGNGGNKIDLNISSGSISIDKR